MKGCKSKHPEWQVKWAIFERWHVRKIICQWAVLSDNTLFLAHLPLTEPIAGSHWLFFRLMDSNKRRRSASGLSLNRLPVENVFKHHRTVSAWCDHFRSKMSYPAADKCETHSGKMINDLRAQIHIQYTALEWNCWINPLHLHPKCQTELFLIAFNWQQFKCSHNTISMILA